MCAADTRRRPAKRRRKARNAPAETSLSCACQIFLASIPFHEQYPPMTTSYFYKSDDPDVLATVRAYYLAKDVFNAGLDGLGQALGGKASSMRSAGTSYAGGIKLPCSREDDIHWRKPDKYGYQALRTSPAFPRGTTKDERPTIVAEHKRLQALWDEHCPARLDSHHYWRQIGVNTGALLMCGGAMFELGGAVYFELGFELRQEVEAAAGQPTNGRIKGAIEILASEYHRARRDCEASPRS